MQTIDNRHLSTWWGITRLAGLMPPGAAINVPRKAVISCARGMLTRPTDTVRQAEINQLREFIKSHTGAELRQNAETGDYRLYRPKEDL